jgi:hypothetical protein
MTATRRPSPAGRDPLARLIAGTQLAHLGGAALVNLLDDRALRALQAEAARQATVAAPMLVARGSSGDESRGDPDRWLDSAPGGPALHAFYHAPQVSALLRSLTGLSWRTTGEVGSFSYYRRPGHHLGLHRDIESCELAVITCVRDDRPAPDAGGGVLSLYPSRAGEPLAQIKRSLESGAVEVRLVPGQSIVLFGGLITHRLTPLAAGQVRVITPSATGRRPEPFREAATRPVGVTMRTAAATARDDRFRRQCDGADERCRP